jgi:hypothetical protein
LFPLSQDLRGYINRIQEAKLGLLIDRTSPIYLESEIKGFNFYRK